MLELSGSQRRSAGTGRADTADRAHGPGCFCTILLLDESRQRPMAGSAGSLPEEYIRAVNGLQIGPDVGACGSAAYGIKRL
jgi:hypothetical protein